MSPSAASIRAQIEIITSRLIEKSMCTEQNFPVLREGGLIREVVYSGIGSLSFGLKKIPYKEIYDAYSAERAFNFKMVDGALVQLLYRYDRDGLSAHRLAFFPSPYLERFQEDPEIYEQDVMFAEVVSRNIVAFPVRFDFDRSEQIFVPVDHPKSHLTLGGYENCRIPVCSPVVPAAFMGFILRNFYNTALKAFDDVVPKIDERFDSCISEQERHVAHVRVSP